MIKVYISTLRSIHYQNHYNTNAFDDSQVELVLRDVKWIYEEEKHQRRLPLIIDILQQIIRYIPNISNNLNLKIALYVTFVGFL